MYNVKKATAQIGSHPVTIETGKLAKQADGAVVMNCGDLHLLVTAVAASHLREGIDFFPLTVDVEERHYAVGRIPGSFFRTEGRPTDKAVLTCRLIDRPLRPTFPDTFRHEVQIIVQVMQADDQTPYDVHGITGASAALLLGGVPFAGPLAGVRMAHIRGRWVVNPTYQELENATLELVVAGRISESGDVDVLMVEAGGFEHTMRLIGEGAPQPTEEVLAEGLEASKAPIRQLCEAQLALVEQCEVRERAFLEVVDHGDDVVQWVRETIEPELREALTITSKLRRQEAVDAVEDKLMTTMPERLEGRESEVSKAFRTVEKKLVRQRIVHEGKRIDGRGPEDLRALHAEVGLFPRVHGTGLFQRGETQALGFATLGMPRMEMMLDTISPEESKRYMHQYKMPPFSVGEAGRIGPNRRQTGHGALAEKAVLPVIPGEDEFPYAIRVVSEVLESNGSTSMASVCASILCLMDAGVPVRDMVGGIAMGLVADDGKYVTLTDIIGAEDAFGDMDFKVAGTRDFVTALQLDTKTTGIPADVLAQALRQAREARLKILDVMKTAIPAPRAELAATAPRIIVETIPVDKIGELIGPKGKNINDIVARTGVQIDIEDDGRVFIASSDGEGAEAALKLVRSIANPVPLEVGEEFEGTVVKTTDFGAFVQILPGKDGLVHISKLGRGQRVRKVEDVVAVGDKIWVRINEVRPDGKLSLVPIDEPGSDGEAAVEAPVSPEE